MQGGPKSYPRYFVKSFVAFSTCLWKKVVNPAFDLIRIKDKLIYQTQAIPPFWIMEKWLFFLILPHANRGPISMFFTDKRI